MALPTELCCEICECVIAISVHVVCTAEKAPVWEMNVIANLTAVSQRFRAIAIDLSAKALAVSRSSEVYVHPTSYRSDVAIPTNDDLRDGSDQAQACRDVMKYLRRMSMGNAHLEAEEDEEDESQIWSKMPDMLRSPLLQGYTIYLNAVNLRKAYRESERKQRESQSSSACSRPPPPLEQGVGSEVVRGRINKQSLQALQLALEKSRLVYPGQMGALLDKAVREEMGQISLEVD
ncbi:hypothetical protein OE88DRAFT_1738855 [Heliocybe sulcata]|uniref:Uncharacterized protein n=1 Tax=Heliocybe sulcata TaxID=5364 RepID=A0A5C3MTR5_9AGAM|nr:hypothetical protein OE88DRAFT_1738855 [Heliocybe sulcata]